MNHCPWGLSLIGASGPRAHCAMHHAVLFSKINKSDQPAIAARGRVGETSPGIPGAKSSNAIWEPSPGDKLYASPYQSVR